MNNDRRGQGHVSRLFKFCPNHIFGVGETSHFKCRVLIDIEVYQCTSDRLPPKGMCSGSHGIYKFWEISDNISETVQDRHMVAKESNRKSYVAYRMAPLPMSLSDLEGHFCCLKPF